ncbi:MAG: ABC transporter permease [Prevotellaceae bacterium]|jgi:ABC-2 type transport system permease protein|nr:ABC transporter permease [Prevotellaceae bacterium]
MNKFRFLIYKDFLLLVRDKAGLAMMFLMPMLLVVIMTYLQNSTFHAVHENHIPLLLLNHDADSLGVAIEKQIAKSGIFDLQKTINGEPVTEERLIAAVAKGDYMIGVIVPEEATAHIRKNVKRYVVGAFNGKALSSAVDSVQVAIYLDPATKSSFRTTLMSSLREYAVRTESDFIFNEIIAEVNRISPIPVADVQLARNQVIFTEQYASLKERNKIPNSAQHNVPAWSMFAIFFITISLSGNIIKERDDGSYTRLRLMPCPYAFYLFSKIAVYFGVCILQFAALMLLGVFAFPYMGLPSLDFGIDYFALLLTCASSALAAIGYGVLIGKVAVTHQQAAIFASISVVIMAAIGGVWIPVFVMPHIMQLLSHISPLNWGLEAFYAIFVRDGNGMSVWPECAASLLFFCLCTGTAIWYNKRKRIDL